MKYLPKLTQVRNEVVAWCGIIGSTVGAFVVAASSVDFTSITGVYLTVGPAIATFTGRLGAYGAVTYEKAVAAAKRS